MSVYFIAQLSIHDRETYTRYSSGFMEIFSKYNGKMLAVDEAPETMEGDWSCTRTVLIEFPTEHEAKSWYESNEYQSLAQHRLASSNANVVMIRGLE
jgi:uncharacterized protein (DUF1330 family)